MRTKQTQRDRAYQHIRQKLVEGALSGGDRLSPATLAREIGISHIPVREAISQLHSEGLIVHTAHRGAFVKEADRRELVELIELRTVLECHAATQAASRITAAQLKELDDRWNDCCRAAEAFNVPPGTDVHEAHTAWLLADLAFHMLVLRAAGNRRVIRVIEETRIMVRMFGHRTDGPAAWADPRAYGTENLQVHKGIFEALRAHDPKAARRAMAAHMRRAGKNMLARYDWLQRQVNVDETLAGEFPASMQTLVLDIQRRELQRLSSPNQLNGEKPSMGEP